MRVAPCRQPGRPGAQHASRTVRHLGEIPYCDCTALRSCPPRRASRGSLPGVQTHSGMPRSPGSSGRPARPLLLRGRLTLSESAMSFSASGSIQVVTYGGGIEGSGACVWWVGGCGLRTNRQALSGRPLQTGSVPLGALACSALHGGRGASALVQGLAHMHAGTRPGPATAAAAGTLTKLARLRAGVVSSCGSGAHGGGG